MTPEDYVAFLQSRSIAAAVLSDMVASENVTTRLMLACDTLMPFTRKPVSALVDLYEHPRHPGPNLLVVFSGRGHRPMIAVPSFLQALDSSFWSVLLLRDPAKMQYRLGIPDYADSFPDLVRRIRTDCAGYDRVVSIGTSMGGFAAIRFALAGGATRGISVGGRFPQDGLALLTGARLPGGYDPICACLPPSERDLVYAFAGQNRADRAAAETAAHLTSGTTIRAEGQKKHLLLFALLEEGKLDAFLADLLRDAPVAGHRVYARG